MGIRGEYNAQFQAVRPKILERDGNICVKCKSALSLEVHHIEGYSNNEPEMLATLCYLCHGVAPMEKEPFEQWLIIGESGIDVIRKRLVAAGLPKMKRGDIEKICGVLIDFGMDTNKLKMKTARDRLEKAGLMKYGRKPYGHKPGEEEILKKMKELNSLGKNPEQISQIFNSEGIPTRYGKKWVAPTVAKILVKERLFKRQPKPQSLPKPQNPLSLSVLEMPDDPSMSEEDRKFWKEVYEEAARGPLPQPKKRKPKPPLTADYRPIETDKGGIWVPLMMHGSELREVN